MSLNCLKDYIGIAGCGAVTPPSGILINSMAGVSLSTLEKLSKEESNTFMAIWNDIQDRAIRRMQIEVQSRFSKRYKVQNIVRNYDFGLDKDTTQVTAASAQYRGIMIDDQYFLPKTNQNVQRSALMTYWIQDLKYYSTKVQAGTEIKIFDLVTGDTLLTKTFDAVIGWNTIKVNSYVDGWSIFIGVNSSTLDSVYKYAPATLQWYPVNVRGASLNIGSDVSTLSLGQNTFGLGGTMGVRCKFDPIVCANLDQFALPFSYLLAAELMFERTASDRINKYTVDKKQAEELKAHYDIKFDESLNQVCEYINLDMADSCLECNQTLTIKESPFFVRPINVNPYD